MRLTGDQGLIMPRCIYWFGHWQPLLTDWIVRSLRPGDTFVDVGANVGYFSLLAARRVGAGGSVIALEPSAFTRRKLTDHVALNRSGNVRVLPTAAASRHGRVPLVRAPWNDAESSTVRRPGMALEDEVEAAAPVSDLLSAVQLASLRLVKLDVEGAELDALTGLAPALARTPRAEVVIEVHPDARAERGRLRERSAGGRLFLWHAAVLAAVDFSERAPASTGPLTGEPPNGELVHLILSRRAPGPQPLDTRSLMPGAAGQTVAVVAELLQYQVRDASARPS